MRGPGLEAQGLDDAAVLVVAGVGLEDQARQEGMQTMYESGVKKVLNGTVAPNELVRVLAASD